MKPRARVTWDGHPVSSEPPYGASIVVYRRGAGGTEFLVLHRTQVLALEGDWAWTPPSGARYPGEAIDACAARELCEETGLALVPVPLREGDADWYLYAALLPTPTPIRLSDEHDACRWVALDQAVALCKPDIVAAGIRDVAAVLNLA